MQEEGTGSFRPLDRLRHNRAARVQWRVRAHRRLRVSIGVISAVWLAAAAWWGWQAAPFMLDGIDTDARVVEVLDESFSATTFPQERSLTVRVVYEVEGRTLDGIVTTRDFEEVDGERWTAVTYVRSEPSRVQAAAANPEMGALVAVGLSGLFAIGFFGIGRGPQEEAQPPTREAVQPAWSAVEFAGRSRQGLTAALAVLGSGMLLLSGFVEEPRAQPAAVVVGLAFLALWPALSAMSARSRVRIDAKGIEAKYVLARRFRWEDVFHVESRFLYVVGPGGLMHRGPPQVRMRVRHGEGSRWVYMTPVLHPGDVVRAAAARLATVDPELAGELAALGRQGHGNWERTRIDAFMGRWGYPLAGTIVLVGVIATYLV